MFMLRRFIEGIGYVGGREIDILEHSETIGLMSLMFDTQVKCVWLY